VLFLPEHRQIARLFDFLLLGEQLAFDCASAQSALFDDAASRKFLRNQARQEKFHYRVFKSGIGILAPKGVTATPGKTEMQDYRRLLEEALQCGDRAETLLGMQVMLEGLGDVALRHIGAGFEPRGLQFLFRRVRHLVAGQEDAHHSFGLRRLQSLSEDEALRQALVTRSQDYLELLDRLLDSVAELFDFFDEDPEIYKREFHQSLPNWLRAETC
jgi:rubrerythrin